MKVKCINQGNFQNITEGKEYEVFLDNGGSFIVISNDLSNRRYDKRYFEVIPEPIIEDIDEVGIEGDPQPKFEMHWDDKNIRIDIDGNDIVLEYYQVASNCGVASYHGINWLYENCNEDINLFKDIILSVIELVSYAHDTCMFILSTNDKYSVIWNVLDEIMDTKSEVVENPNSDMDVKLWIKYV